MELIVPEKKWTDERHDDLNTKVDVGFARVDKKLDDLDRKVDSKIDKLDAKFDKKFDRMNFWLLTAALSFIATRVL
jgi:hypothetical protein